MVRAPPGRLGVRGFAFCGEPTMPTIADQPVSLTASDLGYIIARLQRLERIVYRSKYGYDFSADLQELTAAVQNCGFTEHMPIQDAVMALSPTIEQRLA